MSAHGADPLAALASLLERADVEYALIGGHAVNVWLEPRFTADIDVTVQAGQDSMERLKAVALDAGFRMSDEHGPTTGSGPDFVRFCSSDDLVVIEVQAAKTELQRELIRRARPSESGMRVATTGSARQRGNASLRVRVRRGFTGSATAALTESNHRSCGTKVLSCSSAPRPGPASEGSAPPALRVPLDSTSSRR